MNYKIAVVTPIQRDDFYIDTVLDGLSELKKEHPELEFFYPDSYPEADQYQYICKKGFAGSNKLPRGRLLEYARQADLIILSSGKYGIDFAFVDSINGWRKTAFVDGSELGGDKWRDPTLQLKIINGECEEYGAPNKWALERCALYFRREKPYTHGMIPFPLGIESRFRKHVARGGRKDIDFACMFGQDTHPMTRQYARTLVERFSKKNGFTCYTKTTHMLPIKKGPWSQDKYHRIWSRAKVGICTGGAGYDTRRFWEILGNNCLIIAERVDLYHPDSDALRFKRIYEYNNLYDFEYQLEKVGQFLRSDYQQEDLAEEYQEILQKHSSKARVLTIIREAQKRGILAI